MQQRSLVVFLLLFRTFRLNLTIRIDIRQTLKILNCSFSCFFLLYKCWCSSCVYNSKICVDHTFQSS